MVYTKKTLHARIFETLRDRIIYMEYPPEMNLVERDLCEEFQVSRTPLREAIRMLEKMKLVTVIPRFGTYVSPIDINEIRCAFEVKIRLEALTAELAAQRITAKELDDLAALIEEIESIVDRGTHRELIQIDTRFHEVIRGAARNWILLEILENLHSRCARLWNSTLSEVVPTSEIAGQLRAIYQAISEKDREESGRLMERHVQYFIDKIKMQIL